MGLASGFPAALLRHQRLARNIDVIMAAPLLIIGVKPIDAAISGFSG